jgi:DNA-binding transcriptional ArsR family regulator
MSRVRPRRGAAGLRERASVFAALGDETRLAIVGTLCNGPPQSISRLAEGSKLTRQAITKHLRALEGAGVARCKRIGRESLFELRPEPLKELQTYLKDVSDQWEQALERLKSFVEK